MIIFLHGNSVANVRNFLKSYELTGHGRQRWRWRQWRQQKFHRWFCLPPNLANVSISWVHHSITNKTSWNWPIVQWTKTLHTNTRMQESMTKWKERTNKWINERRKKEIYWKKCFLSTFFKHFVCFFFLENFYFKALNSIELHTLPLSIYCRFWWR